MIGSLFSGIGGLELGLEWSGLGNTAWQVERDEYCRAVLARHWPDAERFDDVCTVGKTNLSPVDIICGGFPCQDVSSAGKGAGLAGVRSGLWFEFLRIVNELLPRWIIVENVASGATKWLDAVVSGLESSSYRCLPVPLSASHVGAPHERARIFVVAHSADADGAQREGGRLSGGIYAEHTDPGRSGVDERSSATVGNTNSNGKSALLINGKASGARGPASGSPVWPALPEIHRVDDGVSRGLDSRSRRLKAIGNSVVPQCAEVIGWMIREMMNG